MMAKTMSANMECSPEHNETMLTLMARAFLYAQGDTKIALARALLQFMN